MMKILTDLFQFLIAVLKRNYSFFMYIQHLRDIVNREARKLKVVPGLQDEDANISTENWSDPRDRSRARETISCSLVPDDLNAWRERVRGSSDCRIVGP